MAKTKEDFQKFADELHTLCDKHGIYTLGVCFNEGIGGEISLVDKDDPSNFELNKNIMPYVNFKVRHNDNYGFYIDGDIKNEV